MQYQYGPQASVAERPRCWSKAFDDGTRECRGCGFQTSCKEEIYRQTAARAAQPAPIFQPYAVPQTVQVMPPQPTYQAPQQQPFRSMTVSPMAPLAPIHQPQQQPQRVAVHPPPQQQYGYGWIQDPLYYTLTSAPPPVRPQMGDETFFDRVVKNTGLAMMESFFGQCLLAVRQMVLPPTPKTIDAPVYQQPPQQQQGLPFRPQ
jgi:hypothetical protein